MGQGHKIQGTCRICRKNMTTCLEAGSPAWAFRVDFVDESATSTKQEGSLIAGPASTVFWLPDGPERAPVIGRLRSRSKIGYWCKSSR
jgi:hypothetical protein